MTDKKIQKLISEMKSEIIEELEEIKKQFETKARSHEGDNVLLVDRARIEAIIKRGISCCPASKLFGDKQDVEIAIGRICYRRSRVCWECIIDWISTDQKEWKEIIKEIGGTNQ